MFNKNNMTQTMIGIFRQESSSLCDKLKWYAGQVYPDIQQEMFDLTLSGFLSLAFGFSMHDENNPERNAILAQFSTSFDATIALAMTRVTRPQFKIERALAKITSFFSSPSCTTGSIADFHVNMGLLDGIGNERELSANVAIIQQVCEMIVKERMEERELAPTKSNSTNLVDIFLHVQDQEMLANDQSKKHTQMSVQLVLDMVLNMLVAGRDTTAITLTWLCTEMTDAIEERMIEEIQTQIQNADSEEDLFTYARLMKSYPYITAVIMETTRLHPAVGVNGKVSVQDQVLPDGVYVPIGTVVLWSNWVRSNSLVANLS